jgi:hypothetical protein
VGNVLPMSVLCMWTSGKFCFLMRARKEDVEPRYESVNVCITGVSKVYNEHDADVQSLRDAFKVIGAVNVRSSFLAVRRLICY